MKTENIKTSKMYEQVWGERLAIIRNEVRKGAKRIDRILEIIDHKGTIQFLNSHEIISQIKKNVPEMNILDASGCPLFMISAIKGAYKIVPASIKHGLLIDVVESFISPETDLVVEFGSGSGRNLFKLLFKIRRKFPDLQLIAAEITEKGRTATNELKALEGITNIETHYFDYNNPDLSFMRGANNVVCFTSHSIEQITFLRHEFINSILECVDDCVCVHNEPVGWQRTKSVLERIKESVTNGTFELKLSDNAFFENFAFHALSYGYNRNLIEIINFYVNNGRIRILREFYDYFGSNPFNPSSLIVWQKLA